MTVGHQLATSDRPLQDVHDVVMLDLDGVVYVGPDAVPGAVEALGAARAAGAHLAYLTNNASRPATEVAEHLRSLGLEGVEDADVITSAQAIARVMAHDLPAGSVVLLVGGEGLRVPLEEHGLRCVSSLDEGPVAVVQGYHRDVGWAELAEASFAIQSGLPWYVSNTDLTIPTPRGVAPGNGSLVQAVRNATGATPIVAGKPFRPLFDETTERVGGARPLMVGDRLDTDIDGAIAAGVPSLAVLTGVSTLAEILAAGPGHRPDFVGADLAALAVPHPAVTVDAGVARCGDAVARLEGGRIEIDGAAPHDVSTLRAATALAWSTLDASGTEAVPGGTLEP